MPVPAIRKIVAGLETALGTVATGTVFVDRPEEDAFGRSQLPARNILTDAPVEFEVLDHGTTLHRGTFDIDLIDKSAATSSIRARLAEMEAEAIGALWNDRTLGGIAQDVRPLNSAPGGTYADAEARTLTVEVLWLTPVGDHFTIIGATGLVP